ncbi:alpha/beta hydrolase [Salinibacillus aidingensis]|uniref:alpha/beta fold hydrolase n=1 Tax=Salinibacillus aidingensis TaxID=237684 RepID=UPI0031DDC088
MAESDKSARELMLKFIEMRPELGDYGIKIHVHNTEHKTDYARYTNEEWNQFLDRTNVHNSRLIEGEEIFKSILPMLKEVKQPSLLIGGQYDPVTCNQHLEKFCEDVKAGNAIMFRDSGHFSHSEVPDAFAEAVVKFLN